MVSKMIVVESKLKYRWARVGCYLLGRSKFWCTYARGNGAIRPDRETYVAGTRVRMRERINVFLFSLKCE